MTYSAREPNCPFIVSWKGHGITEVKTAWKKARERAGVPGLLIHDLRLHGGPQYDSGRISEKRAMVDQQAARRTDVFKRYDITDERDIQADGERLARYLERRQTSEERRKLEADRPNWLKFVQKFVQNGRRQKGRIEQKGILFQ